MKKCVRFLPLIALTLSLVFSLTACSLFGGGSNKGGGKPPVYKSMAVSTSPIGGTDTFIYAETYQVVYITINLDNTDDLTIASVKISGKTYEASEFESGSSRQKIIVKANALDATGIVSYTLESVAYIDGKVKKEVTLSGDKTVKVGVYAPNQVYATVTETVGFNEVTFNVNVHDGDGLIAFSSGSLKIEVYTDETLIDGKELTVGFVIGNEFSK